MPNAARKLHTIFANWKEETNTSTDQDVARLVKTTGLGKHILAARHLVEIEHEVDQLEAAGRNVLAYRRLFPEWTRTVFIYPWGFNQVGLEQELYSDYYMDVLDQLAERLDDLGASVDPSSLDDLRNLLSEAEQLLAEDTSLSEQLRRYLQGLLAECRAAVDDFNAFGRFDVGEVLQRLTVAMKAAAGESTDPTRAAKWRAFAGQTVVGSVAGAIGSIPSIVFTSIAGGS